MNIVFVVYNIVLLLVVISLWIVTVRNARKIEQAFLAVNDAIRKLRR